MLTCDLDVLLAFECYVGVTGERIVYINCKNFTFKSLFFHYRIRWNGNSSSRNQRLNGNEMNAKKECNIFFGEKPFFYLFLFHPRHSWGWKCSEKFRWWVEPQAHNKLTQQPTNMCACVLTVECGRWTIYPSTTNRPIREQMMAKQGWIILLFTFFLQITHSLVRVLNSCENKHKNKEMQIFLGHSMLYEDAIVFHTPQKRRP